MPEYLPNLLTFARIAAIPPLALLFQLTQSWAPWAILGLYAAAAVTDYFDGRLARALARESRLGQFLDPIADKLLVIAMLFLLAGTGRLGPAGIAAGLVIVAREVFIAGLREYLAGRAQLPVTGLAKWKTAAQMTALGLLAVAPAVPDWPVLDGGLALLGLAAALALATGWQYFQRAWPYLADRPITEEAGNTGTSAENGSGSGRSGRKNAA